MKSRERSCRSIRVSSHIPDDVIVNILSWLPVKSVLRFKCVCKSWKRITEWSVFIEMHKSQSKCQFVYEPRYKSSTGSGNDDETYYNFTSYSNGLVLERSSKSGEYRIRNPATKQVLQVEEIPQMPMFGKSALGFDSSTSTYKLINMHMEPPSPYIGLSMFTFGIDDDAAVAWSWRFLDGMNLYAVGGVVVITITDKELCYIISICYKLEKSEIIRITLDGKSSMFIKFPQGFLSAAAAEATATFSIKYELYQVFVFDDDKLVLGLIIKQELHAWVWMMENENEIGIWSEEKIVIPLDFMKDYPKGCKISLDRLSKSQLHVTIDNHLLQYDIHSRKYTCLAAAPLGKEVLYQLTPCLVSLKGMHSEHLSRPALSRSRSRKER